jgi:hypothetical protein
MFRPVRGDPHTTRILLAGCSSATALRAIRWREFTAGRATGDNSVAARPDMLLPAIEALQRDEAGERRDKDFARAAAARRRLEAGPEEARRFVQRPPRCARNGSRQRCPPMLDRDRLEDV